MRSNYETPYVKVVGFAPEDVLTASSDYTAGTADVFTIKDEVSPWEIQ